MSETENTPKGTEQTDGTAKATGGHDIIIPSANEAAVNLPSSVSDTEEKPEEAVYKAFQDERERMLAVAQDRNLLSAEEKQIGVDNIKRFFLVALSLTAQGQSVLADGKVTAMEGFQSLSAIMSQMPNIEKIKLAQVYAEFKDLDADEIGEVLFYLQERGKAVDLDETALLKVAEATFRAIGYLQIAANQWKDALAKG